MAWWFPSPFNKATVAASLYQAVREEVALRTHGEKTSHVAADACAGEITFNGPIDSGCFSHCATGFVHLPCSSSTAFPPSALVPLVCPPSSMTSIWSLSVFLFSSLLPWSLHTPFVLISSPPPSPKINLSISALCFMEDLTLWHRLFERGASLVGLDFLAHPFWDKYIEYEERQEAQDRIYAIHARVIRIPLHQYARYYERFRTLTHTQPLSEVVAADVLSRFQAEVEAESAAYGSGARPELEVERDVRAKIDAMYYELFTATQQEVSKRWTYESEIKRPYFHVTQLDHSQLNNWRKYLDFEESEGDFQRVVSLYDRCLVTCAFYDEFWFRYARWMSAQEGKDEEVRNIYIRASIFVPISRPGIRMQWAYFEEGSGRIDIALDIHAAILMKLPDCVEVIVSWAHLQRRQKDFDAAIQVLRDHTEAPTVDLYTKAALVAEWAQMLWKAKGSAEEARAVFLKNAQWYGDSLLFWEKWFTFELEQSSTGEEEEKETVERIKKVFDDFRTQSRLSMAIKRELAREYMNYLVHRGGKQAMKTFLEVDREMFG